MGSDRSDLDLVVENPRCANDEQCLKFSDQLFLSGSLTEMLKISDARCSCQEDNDTDEGVSISKEDIEWFQENNSKIIRQRDALRAKLVARFENMQIRLSGQVQKQ